MTHSIYIATCLERREDAQHLAGMLRAHGHTVTSGWHDLATATRAHDDAATARVADEIAHENMRGIRRGTSVLVLVDERCRGTLCEIGYACALSKRVALVRTPAHMDCRFSAMARGMADREVSLPAERPTREQVGVMLRRIWPGGA